MAWGPAVTGVGREEKEQNIDVGKPGLETPSRDQNQPCNDFVRKSSTLRSQNGGEEGSDDFSAFLSVLRSIKDSAHSFTLTEVGYMLTLGFVCILSNAFDAK